MRMLLLAVVVLMRASPPIDLLRSLYNYKQVPVQVKQSTPKKNPPPTTRPEKLVGFWINLASRTIVRVLDARLRPLGFAMSHLPVLRALAQGGALSQKELARMARVEQQTMAELLAR